jgi:hypothetical protein
VYRAVCSTKTNEKSALQLQHNVLYAVHGNGS